MRMYPAIKKYRSALLVYLTHKMALPVLRLIRNPVLFPYSMEELRQLPENTMGHDLVLFLEARQLELLPYYAKHDIKHILLDYDTMARTTLSGAGRENMPWIISLSVDDGLSQKRGF